MSVVVDSSIAASWGMPDESSPAALRALSLATEDGVIVPSHFWHEMRNVFLVNERRGRLTAELTQIGIALVLDTNPVVYDEGDHATVLMLARRHMLSSYDSAYLELAVRQSSPLATLDKRLAQAALAEKLTVVSDLA